MRLRFSLGTGATLLAALLWASNAGAASFTLEVGTDAMGTTTLDQTQLGCGMPNPDGSFTCMGTNMSMPMQGWDLDMWNITLDPDPFVNATLAVTNTTGATQKFLLEVILPLDFSWGPPVRMLGSIGGSLTDANLSGSATVGLVLNTALNIPADPLYAARIDGATVRSLNASLPLTVTPAGNTATLGPDRFGIPTLEVLNATTATTNIAIRLRFSLTPGDSASFTSVFSIVPEPGTALLVGGGLLGLLAAGRRRRAP